uniref:C-type lectin domain-containing protein n=1 Tax=Echeneis naucrates TaxID=173247 RepID=A0A665VJI4_ECHNA
QHSVVTVLFKWGIFFLLFGFFASMNQNAAPDLTFTTGRLHFPKGPPNSLALTTWAWTYHYSDTPLPWDEARQYCQKMYTDMVIIQNQDENDYLLGFLPEKRGRLYYWIGITKHPKNDTWYWVGNNSTWVGNASWAANEPNHDTDFCVELYVRPGKDHGKWNDENCSNKKYAVCFTGM